MPHVNVAIAVPIHKTFTYSLPNESLHLAKPGMRVVVPFRGRKRIGYIMETDVEPPTKTQIRPVSSFPDEEPQISQKMLKLIRWISDYYTAPIGEVCRTALPNLLNSEKALQKKRRTPRQYVVDKAFHKEERVKFTPDQQGAWEQIKEVYETGKFATILLHGVTGSGKTELYLELMELANKEEKQTILLVPEIALTPQLTGRVVSRFGDNVAIYHSGLTETQRLHQWRMVNEDKVKIIVGTRSAIFAPTDNLGAIIVDEEHDNSYKQEDSPRYNARDVAIMRCKLEKALTVLGSATPSIESYHNAKAGKYHYVHLPERPTGASMPAIEIVDMKREIKSELLNPFLSIRLLECLESELESGHQAMLFLNRRGFASFSLCRDCGFIPECPNCRISLTFHKGKRSLICHYCGYRIAGLDTCPDCKGVDIIGMGSGTEMIEEVLRERLPGARIARLDRDTATSERRRQEILSKMQSGGLDILVGTQMITKGHDFPNVTLVGIISADQSLHFPDFRSSERTYQLITQVAGRAGRSRHPGRVIVQTYAPENTNIDAVARGKFDQCIHEEIDQRRELAYPPFSRLANIRISGNKETRVIQSATDLATVLNKICAEDNKTRILGPAPAPLAIIRGRHRWQILIKSPSAKRLAKSLAHLRTFTDSNPVPGIQIAIDVDPVSTM